MCAPNLESLLGSEVAQDLVKLAGGLGGIAELPAVALRHLGEQGSSSSYSEDQRYGAGVLLRAPLLAGVSRDNKRKAVAKLANKVKLAASVDASKSTPDGSYGSQLRDELAVAFDALDAPGPGRDVKALPVPTMPSKPTRAGTKLKRVNAKYEATVLERKAQVVEFGKDLERQRDELTRSREVLAAERASREAAELKAQRIAQNGGRPNTRGSSNSGLGDKRVRADAEDELLNLVVR